MNDQIVAQAKSAWPIDTVFPGKSEVHITGKYVYPKLWDHAMYVGAAVFILVGYLSATVGTAGLDVGKLVVRTFIITLFLGQAAAWIVGGIVYFMLRRNLDIMISPDNIRINGKTYPRNVPIEFAVERHRKAIIEEERGRQAQTWRRAIEVVMRYGERRITVAEMRERDMEKATALVIRLQNWCERFDAAMAQAASQAKPLTAAPGAGDFGPAPDVR